MVRENISCTNMRMKSPPALHQNCNLYTPRQWHQSRDERHEQLSVTYLALKELMNRVTNETATVLVPSPFPVKKAEHKKTLKLIC